MSELSQVRIYADILPDVDQSMKEVCVQLRITRKKFLEQSIAQGVAAAKAAIAAEKKGRANVQHAMDKAAKLKKG